MEVEKGSSAIFRKRSKILLGSEQINVCPSGVIQGSWQLLVTGDEPQFRLCKAVGLPAARVPAADR